MCLKLESAIKKILKWPYVRVGGTSFELQAATEIANSLGLSLYTNKDSLPANYVLQHPNGKQMPPDIFIKTATYSLNIECKASKTDGSLMWNSGIPEPDYFYLYNCDKGTTILQGTDIITYMEHSALVALKVKFGHIKTIENSTLAQAGGSWKLQHIRPMFEQELGDKKWFAHPDKVPRELASLKVMRNK